MSRTASGLAAVCLGLGASLITTPAWADSPQGSSGTYSFICADQVDDLSDTIEMEFYVAAPAEGEVGEEIEFEIQPGKHKYSYYVDGGDITSATLSADVELGGGAAPSPTATASTEAQGAFSPDGDDTFDDSPLRGTFTPTAPGEVTLAPGEVTVEVTQTPGPSTTVCSPDSATEALATVTVTVTGEPVETESTGNADASAGAGDDGALEQPVAAGDGGTPQSVLIAGAVAGGLLVIVGIGMFGLMFFFMRRS